MKASGPSEEIYGKSTQKHNVEKYFQWFTTLSLAIRVYLHLFTCCCLHICKIPRNTLKIIKLIVVQGHPSNWPLQ